MENRDIAGGTTMKERRYDIDWLRVIAMLTVFVFHCSRFFCNEDWHLKVPPSEQSEILKMLRDMLAGVWNMELFFLLAGFATWYRSGAGPEGSISGRGSSGSWFLCIR
jgi:peptidoglycan/LPS O-acetylase OafA/YrhL